MTALNIRAAQTSDDIPMGPFSEDDLRQQWNAQADEHNQWESLDSAEQLAWAQARAIGADRCARTALKAEPEGEGPTLDRVNLIGFAFGREPWATWLQKGGCLESAHCELSDLMLAAITRWGCLTTPPPLPPDYIDPEHAGQDRELLEAFYQAERAEGGTADECILRGIKAVLAARPATQAAPAPAPSHVEQLADIIWQVDGDNRMGPAALAEAILERYLCAFLVDPLAAPPAPDVQRDAVIAAVTEALGGAYDCLRVWEAWSVGTMGQDDFALTAEDDDRVAEIADAAIEVIRSFQVSAAQAGEVQPPRPTFLDAIRLAQGCHDYSGGHSGQQGEAFQDGVGTVVAVLKKAAVGPWDSQTMAVFGVGSEPQAGEGEA